jgi:predicted transcriptional regulator
MNGNKWLQKRYAVKEQVSASVRITPALHARVVTLARARQRTPHALMVQAIESFVSREEQREALRREACAAHEEFVRTGLHATAEEADAWLAALAAGNDVEPPKCHI